MKDITVGDVIEAVKAILGEVMESKPYLYKPLDERKANQARN